MSRESITTPHRDEGWTLAIVGGANAGASLPLDVGTYTLGSLLSNDIVLADPAVADQHVRIDVGASGARATPLASGVSGRRRALEPGRTIELRPGTMLRFGQTQIRISRPRGQPRSYRSAKVAAALLLLMGGFAGAFQLAAPVAMATHQSSITPDQTKASVETELAQNEMEEHLASVGLGGIVRLETSGRVMTATGALLASEHETWLAAQQWFDGRFGQNSVLIDRVGAAPRQDLPKLDIAAVALLPIPHVITRDGDHYILGAVLPGGWAISGITGRAVTFTRGARSVAIAL